MKIARIETWMQHVDLKRPYTIALKATDAVDMMFVRIEADDGSVGLGSATPEATVTGETLAMCQAALAATAVDWLVGRNVDDYRELGRKVTEGASSTPGACAALEMALWDLGARSQGLPLVDMLGRVHDALPTSITIGIMSLAETLSEADEYLARGFRHLKMKIGNSVAEDVERIVRTREHVGDDVAIRVDANQGYGIDELHELLTGTAGSSIEFVEQPSPPSGDDALRKLPISTRRILAGDESLMGERDAIALSAEPQPYGTFVIKLMKCGGIGPALAIAKVAEAASIDLMWGCMDESVIGISAALHAAFACPRTRYLDLDGSLDLREDVAIGGFMLEGGIMRTLDQPGLGAALRNEGQ